VRLSLIVHLAAGGGRAGRALAEVQAALASHQLEHHVEITRSLEHARELALAAAAAGEAAVAFGGDGLIGAVAGALCDSDGVVGVLPGGRGNDFARVLGIPLQPAAACDVLANGSVRVLDMGQVGARTFVGIASCGFDSDANRIANETRLFGGRLVYVYGALRALVSWKPATFTVSFDGAAARTVTGYSVAAANARAYGGGMLLAPDASMQDGLFDVVMISRIARLRFLGLLPTVFSGRHVRQANVEVVRAKQIELSADRPLTIYADGDAVAELPASIRVLPSAVRVLAPR
jgi:YegS/Rv2252/BmrU family lipid kinase